MQNKERQLAIEVGEKCCMCLPIKCGLSTMAVINVIGFILGFINAILAVLVFNVVGLLMLLISIPNLYAGYLCLIWLCKDNTKTRAGLTLAMLIELVYYFLSGILFVIYAAV